MNIISLTATYEWWWSHYCIHLDSRIHYVGCSYERRLYMVA